MSKSAIAALAFGLMLGGSALADVVTFRFTLEGSQEVPSVTTSGTGHGVARLDTVTRMVEVHTRYEGLTGTATNAHLHGLSARGVNSNPIVQFTFNSGVTSGTAQGSGTLSVTNANGVLNGMSYANIHSTFKGGGEIRGQVEQHPCPADYNGDGFVDGIDYDLFNNDFESTNPSRQIIADYNGDGFVDGIDYDNFNNDFETPCP